MYDLRDRLKAFHALEGLHNNLRMLRLIIENPDHDLDNAGRKLIGESEIYLLKRAKRLRDHFELSYNKPK